MQNHRQVRREKISIGDALIHLGARKTLAAVTAIILASVIVVSVFTSLYKSERERIQLQGRMNAMQSAEEFDSYIQTGTNSVKFATYTIDNLMYEGASDEDILGYMTEETSNIQNTINRDFTGLYGWINKKYMDGAGWDPGPDFVAVERPWYAETMEKDTEISYVTPYLDLETNNVMMTVTGRLRDGSSVVALDIPMKRMQEITEKIAEGSDKSIGMVLADNGTAVVHSDEKELGKNYLEETDSLGGIIARMVISEGRSNFSVKYGETDYTVYSQKLDCGWYSVSVMDTGDILRPLRRIQFMAFAAMIAAALFILGMYVRISMREMRTRNLANELSAMGDIYETVYDIDLGHDTFREISARADVVQAVGGHGGSAQTTLYEALSRFCDERSKHVMLEFADLSSLDERLSDKVSVTEEFIGISGKWFRARFIASERDEEGHLLRVMWLVESVDTEKRRSEELLRLSETDRMTGLLNRISGEERVSALLAQNVSGMFMMIDADKFKSINDTYGHNVGDEVLIAIANAMKNSFRSGDVLMRIGGDEFGAFSPGVATKENGDAIIKRLTDSLRSNHIEALGGQPIKVSIGATLCSADEDVSFERLYRQADESMYVSKNTEGRSVTYHEDAESPETE